jgi:cold shock CspA family protein
LKEVNYLKGVVTWYNYLRGKGFINGDDGKEISFHIHDIANRGLDLYEKDHVEYKVQRIGKNLKAIGLKKI